MQFTMQHGLDHTDIPALRAFLAEQNRINPRVLWDHRRLDGFLYHRDPADMPAVRHALAHSFTVWRNENGVIVAALLSEASGHITPHVHPDANGFIPAIATWLARPDAGNPVIWCHDEDTRWTTTLTAMHYKPGESVMLLQECQLQMQPKPSAALPTGYTTRRNTTSDADTAQMARLLNASFERDIHTPAEYRHYQTNAPCYRDTHDLVVVDSAGTYVATLGVTILEEHHSAVIEPLATDPNARQRGCATALLEHALQIAQEHGCHRAYVGVSAENSKALRVYARCGFATVAHERGWVRTTRDA
ncbi:MAG: hypothetical protein RLY87_259 [Chloroflexota bacterium]